MNELLPFFERQLVERGVRARNDRAAADRVHENVDLSVSIDGSTHDVFYRSRVEGIRSHGEGTRRADLGGQLVESGLIEIDRDHCAAFTADDRGRRPAYSRAGSRDERDPVLESHRDPSRCRPRLSRVSFITVSASIGSVPKFEALALIVEDRSIG